MDFPRFRLWLALGAFVSGSAVALGAFGAHRLRGPMLTDGLDSIELRQLENWETAARYAMYHGLALLAVGLLAMRRCGLAVNLAGTAFTLGTLIFSGCLFALVLTGETWLGAVVPIGGLLLIAGWVALLVAALRLPADQSHQA